jgi:uncharacterized protein (TIGR04255 family)
LSAELNFQRPPLNEVVVGVQFAPVPRYSQIHAGEVWQLFRDRFPLVEEHLPLEPAFETFGLPQLQGVSIRMLEGARHDRFWFLTEDGAELIQFQSDRFLHNWRKRETEHRPYPRFEPMFRDFQLEMLALEQFFAERFGAELEVTQAEVSYINRIYSPDGRAMPRADQWLKFLRFGSTEPDDYSGAFRETIRDESGTPIGRLTCEVKSAVTQSLRPIILFTMLARGAPSTPRLESAFDFIKQGREKIAHRFDHFTTAEAQEYWGREA